MGFFKKTAPEEKAQRVVPNRELVRLSAAFHGQELIYAMVSTWLMYYCTDVLYLGAGIVGTIIGICRVWDAVNDPLAGAVVDRHRFKSGEKLRPLLKILPLPLGLSSMLIFFNFGFASKTAALAYVFIFYLIWDILYSFHDLALYGMTSVMSPHSTERGRIVQWITIAGGTGFILPGFLLQPAIDNSARLGLTQSQVFAVFGVLCGLGGGLLTFFAYAARERTPSPPPEGSLRESLHLVKENRIMLLLILANILNSLSITVPPQYFFKYMVEVEIFGRTVKGLTMMSVSQVLLGIPTAGAMFFATKAAKKLGGMKNVLVLASFVNIIFRAAAYLIGYEGNRFWIVIGMMSVASVPLNMMAIATTTLWGDSIDYVEWKTGRRTEGISFSLQNFKNKITGALSTIIAGFVLELLRFDASKYELGRPQSDAFNKWIWPVFMLGPAIGSLLYLLPVLALKYPRSMQLRVEKDLALRREQNAARKASENPDNASAGTDSWDD